METLKVSSPYTSERLIAFSDRVAQAFKDKRIHAPVHLAGGNEIQLIKVFKSIRSTDWVFSTWRSSYHALLHGLPEEYVFDEILVGRSMYLSSQEPKFLSSAIVAGICSIAVGVALGIKRLKDSRPKSLMSFMSIKDPKVHVFVGDTAARTGQFWEAFQYSVCNQLDIRFIVEDNGLSTDTPTSAAWGAEGFTHYDKTQSKFGSVDLIGYKYERTRPHCGINEFVQF